METSNVQPTMSLDFAGAGNAPPQNNYNDIDMDIDMDIDLSIPAEAEAQLEPEAMRTGDFGINAGAAFTNQAPAAEAQPDKVHIRGLDNLTTGEIKAFALEHFPTDRYVRIEWIDDTSANIVYEDAETAFAALGALSDPSFADVASLSAFELRKARPFYDKPDVDLAVRQAVVTDVKRARAHEASRFYLMNPDKDPREQRRRGRSSRGNGDFKKRRYDDNEQRRRKQAETFDVDMYDEDGGSDSRARSRRRTRRRSDSLDSRRDDRRGRGRRRSQGDLFGSKKDDGRLRDRSASPLRDGDGRYGFAEDQNSMARKVRRRSYTPPSTATRRDPGVTNSQKELFPVQKPTSVLSTASPTSPRELFPHKHTPGKRSRELFPNKTAHSNHRRQDAFDAADGTEGFIGNMPRSLEERINANNPRSLEDRINNPLSGSNVNGRGRHNGQAEGFSVKGAGEQAPGFHIRGAASEPVNVKELFPIKSGSNAGKELFGDKIKGRGAARRRAEDMFF
ncbi:uncharacterized protein J3D65DRAFT_102329 [Phyllosticta citribraziliensis]|uniref:Nucleotide-binding, alpha-beta plait n=1 Tax=Phyllosticta citribraziliensis TaxID=989973 RepID=A0ABR1LAQ9_9PEZI